MASKGSIWASIGLKTDEFKKSLTDLQIKTKSTGSKLSSALSSINPISLGITTAVAGIGAAIYDVGQTVVKFDEAIADLRKTTGLGDESARNLAQTLMTIDTKSSVSELMELATAAGRLGIAEKDIKDFVEQSDKLFVALGDDLGGTAEQIATNIGKISSVFGVELQQGVGEGLNKIGSVFNELAGNTKAGAGSILDFTNRMAGIAPAANISVQNIAGLGATLDSFGQSMEVGASTLAKLLPEMGKNLPHFAKLAGVSVQEFSSIMKKDGNEALLMVLEGAKSTKGGIEGLTQTLGNLGVDSARAAGIVGVLSENIDVVRENQALANKAFEEGTSLTNEFNIKNETLGATFKKLGNTYDKMILSIENGSGVFSMALKSIVGGINDVLEAIGGLFQGGDFVDLANNWAKATGGMQTGVKGLNETIENVDKSFSKLTDEQLRSENTIRKMIGVYQKLGLSKDEISEKLRFFTSGTKENTLAIEDNNTKVDNSIALTNKQIKAIEDRNKAIQNALKDDAEEIEIPISGFVLEGDKEDIWGDIKADIPLEIDTDELDKDLDVVNEKFDMMRERVIASGQAINNALMGVAQGGLEAIGASIGEAMAGGEGFASIAMTFAQTIADAVGSLGQQLISIGITMTGIQKALATAGFANPALLIGGGIALVALSQMMKTSMAKPVGFADGGLVTGSVFANIGEGIGTTSANPEVIAPLNKLKDFMPSGDGGMGGNVKFRIEGNTLVGILQRQEKTSKYSR